MNAHQRRKLRRLAACSAERAGWPSSVDFRLACEVLRDHHTNRWRRRGGTLDNPKTGRLTRRACQIMWANGVRMRQ